MRLASFSLLLIEATRAAARASGAADESHTRLDLSGPFAQSGYLTPALAGTTSAPRESVSAEKRTIVLGWDGVDDSPLLQQIGDGKHPKVHLDGIGFGHGEPCGDATLQTLSIARILDPPLL